jgi:hypothetical protein
LWTKNAATFFYLIIIGFQEVCGQHLVPGEELLEGGEGVGGDVEGGDLYVLEEVEEVLRVEDNLGQRLESDTLPQHCPTVQGNLLMLIACTKRQQIDLPI